MIHNIIIGLSAAFALIQLQKVDNKYARFIIFVLVVAMAISFLPNISLKTFAFILYLTTTMAAIIYILLKKPLSIKARLLMLFICIPVFIRYITALMHWRWESLILFIPIISFALLLISNPKGFKNEVAFLTIITVDAMAKLTV